MTNKKELSERDICTQFILPALVKAGWNVSKQVREEVYFTDGRIFVKGSKTVRGERKRKENEQAWKVSIDTIVANGYNLDIKNPHMPEDTQTHTSAELVAMLHESFRKSDEFLAKLKKELTDGF